MANGIMSSALRDRSCKCYLLTLPNQAQWLDSGEMDERIYDFESGGFVDNEGNGIRGRQNGLVQCNDVFAHAQPQSLDSRVEMNKVLLENRMRSSFEIPFLT